MRLNKFIASNLNIGRRAVDDLITAGKITVNGQPAHMGQQVSEDDIIKVHGEDLQQKEHVYLMLNKPVGYVCSRRSQGGDPTIYELLPKHYQHLKSVGRLDKNSSGLILITNDGELTHQLTHPKFAKIKIYNVHLDKPLQPLHHQMIADVGLDLPDGKSKLGLTPLNDDKTEWEVTMHEGRNRQIRRTFGALGYNVTKLHRTRFGNLHLGQLASGETSVLSHSEIL